MPNRPPRAAITPYADDLALLLATNEHITAAWLNSHNKPTLLTICIDELVTSDSIHYPQRLNKLPIHIRGAATFGTLEAPDAELDLTNHHQVCQHEPVKLGTQIQPAGANWVGTAGAPVRWIDALGHTRYGILSNWHVMDYGTIDRHCEQHQPTLDFPPIARLSDSSPVTYEERMTIDAAIADALIQELHTISPEIIGIGQLKAPPRIATVGLPVLKSGRTTKVTYARCTAVGAAVKVGYGGFTATFQDQDIYTADTPPFSAPGDSGSLIISRGTLAPVSLLFAGGGNLTIGNPMRHVAARFQLQFPFE